MIDRSEGRLQFLPFRDLWAVSGLLADTFPLDRDLVRGPRCARQASNWARLALVDRAVTNPDHTAVLTLGDTPWIPAVAVAVLAALIVPRLPRGVRVVLFAGFVGWVGAGQRGSRFVAMRRQLGLHARRGIVVADFVAREPGAGLRWAADALDALGHEIPLVALVPASGDARRDAARERLYVRRLGFRRVARTEAGGQQVTILVRS